MNPYVPNSLSGTIANSRSLLSSTRALIQRTSENTSQGKQNIQQVFTSLERLSTSRQALKHRALRVDKSDPPAVATPEHQAMETTLHMLMHDIRSPINNITSLLELLRASHELPESLRQLVELVNEQSEKAYALTQFHMLYQQLEAGTYQPDRSPVDLLALLTKIRRQIQSVHRTNEIELWVNGERAAPPQAYWIASDAQATELMLQNLIQNAVEASPPYASVRIDISERPQTPDEQAAGQPPNPCISIRNQGMIPVSIQSRFFEKFVTSGKSRGTGLGTYIARQVAKAHGGGITFVTSADQGTILSIELPSVSVIAEEALGV